MTWFVSLVAGISVAGMLLRPWRLPQWAWPLLGAGVLLISHALAPADALQAFTASVDVLAFLAGMMLLAEIADEAGVFAWIADRAVRLAHGSNIRLWVLMYCAGIVVTMFLSNDATAVVLTRAVAAVTKRAKVDPWPHVLGCAFVANAASFLLPVANPANLVVYGSRVPAPGPWLQGYGLPAIAAIVATAAGTIVLERTRLRASFEIEGEAAPLGPRGCIVLCGIALTAVIFLAAMARGWSLGACALGAGLALGTVASFRRPRVIADYVRGISWGVLVLVVGLFMISATLEHEGIARYLAALLQSAGRSSMFELRIATGVTTTFACALANNLPVGLVAGQVASAYTQLVPGAAAEGVRRILLVSVDLGPNVAVTGSLATLLWMDALRRNGIEISTARFFRTGLAVTTLGLCAALACLR